MRNPLSLLLFLYVCLCCAVGCSSLPADSQASEATTNDTLTTSQANVLHLVSEDSTQAGISLSIWLENDRAEGTASHEGQNRIQTLTGNRLLNSLVLFELLDGDTTARYEGSISSNRYQGLRYKLDKENDSKDVNDSTGPMPFDFRIDRMPYALQKQNLEHADSSTALKLDLHIAWFEMAAPTRPALRDAFNRLTHGQAEGLQSEFEKEVAEAAQGMTRESLPDYARLRTLDLEPELIFVHPNLLATRILTYTYHGGAHPMYGFSSFLFDTKADRMLKPEELFADGKLPLKFLSAASLRALKTQLGPDHPDDMLRSGTAPQAENFQTLLPTAYGLLVIFSPYQVGPYAVGAPEVMLPWHILQKNVRLSPALEAIVGSGD